MKRKLRLLGAFVALAVALGCSSEDPNHPPPKLDKGGGQIDAIVWPDWGPPKQDFWFPDYGLPKHDGQPPTGDGPPVTEGGPPPQDGSSGCTGPQNAKCAPACQASQLCTEASGGRCAKVYTLSGAASDKAVFLQVALAYVDCWSKAPSVDTLCSTFDACNMTGTLTSDMVKNWICNTAQVSDFPSNATYDEAKKVVGCAIYQDYKPDWQIPTLDAGAKGLVCLSYDSISWWPDDMDVDSCKNFPPK